MKRHFNYIILVVSCFLICCGNSSKEEFELIYFKKKCLDNNTNPNSNKIANNFIQVDTTKNVEYDFVNNNLICKIYTRYDCIDEEALNGSFLVKNDTIYFYMHAKSNGLASSCYCYSFLEYKIKCPTNKKYTVRYLGIKYEPK